MIFSSDLNHALCVMSLLKTVFLSKFLSTVKSAHIGQARSQTKSTVRSRCQLTATVTDDIFLMDRIKKKIA